MSRQLSIIVMIAFLFSACGTPASKRFNRVPDSQRPTEEEMRKGREEAEAEEDEADDTDDADDTDGVDEEEVEPEESEEDEGIDDSKPY